MNFTYDAEIKQLEGKIKWRVIYFPHDAGQHFGSKGNIPVRITVDGFAFGHTLLGSRNGHYLVYNEFIRKAVGKELGDTVHVTLEKDDKPRVFSAPEHIENAMKNALVWETFSAQPDYLKREQVNKIEAAAKEKTKQNRLGKLVELLQGGAK